MRNVAMKETKAYGGRKWPLLRDVPELNLKAGDVVTCVAVVRLRQTKAKHCVLEVDGVQLEPIEGAPVLFFGKPPPAQNKPVAQDDLVYDRYGVSGHWWPTSLATLGRKQAPPGSAEWGTPANKRKYGWR